MLERLGTWDMVAIVVVIVLIYALIYPRYQIWGIQHKRLKKIQRMERKWKSKVLTMIHRKEAISLLGIPVYQFIDVEDAEEILRGIRKAKGRPIDLIIHTPGGQMHASIQIARTLKSYPARTRVMIPHYAMSSGTIIALAADEIVMDKNAVLGPIDPQVGDFVRGIFPAPSWVRISEHKGTDADDATLIIGDISEKALDLMRSVTRELLEDKFSDKEKLDKVVEKLVSGEMVHIHPISASEARSLGLPVSTELPEEVHEFMSLYRAVKASVQYL
ncbi:MAG: ATP-dependent Clp protease proteolytic subunit [Methanocellales archaeon]|nr:ATP-dependent Clp protease proteolytic subunit [Methanocellales archaeon]MDI6902893.1 ATP-dependent Clp protease proteolytic subunit [Methanocellales archaeon]